MPEPLSFTRDRPCSPRRVTGAHAEAPAAEEPVVRRLSLEGDGFELSVRREIGLAECVAVGAAQPIETAGESDLARTP
jgi:hypothetical protein